MTRPLSLFLLLILGFPILGAGTPQTKRVAAEKDINFRLEEPLEFKGLTVSGNLRASEIPELLNLPVRNGDTDPNSMYGVEMTRPNHTKFPVYTCREYRQARAVGAYAATTYDMAMEGFLIRACGLLFQLQKAKLPTKSFLGNPRVGLNDLNLLPAEILASMPGESDADRLRESTVAEVVAPRNIKKVDQDTLALSYGGFEQIFWEAARADFNGDGIEDIFVLTGGRAEGGTMGYSDFLILTRTQPSGRLKLVKTRSPW